MQLYYQFNDIITAKQTQAFTNNLPDGRSRTAERPPRGKKGRAAARTMSEHEQKHADELAGRAGQHKQMPDGMHVCSALAEGEKRYADGVRQSAGEQAGKAGGRHGGEQRGHGRNYHPAHDHICYH